MFMGAPSAGANVDNVEGAFVSQSEVVAHLTTVTIQGEMVRLKCYRTFPPQPT